jgi:DNA-binding FadR family transcriptional regulator
MIDTLCAGDPDKAEAAVRRHLRSVVETLPAVDNAVARRI